MRLTQYTLFSLVIIASLIACNDEPEIIEFEISSGINTEDYAELSKYVNLPIRADHYFVKPPQHLTNFGFRTNFVDHKLATIGRVLFYDTRLSIDGDISCASCHDQKKAFADDLKLSKGTNNLLTDRNSFALAAAASFDSYDDQGGQTGGSTSALIFGWDNSKANLFEVMETALTKSNEMGHQSITDVARRLQNDPVYQILLSDFNGQDKMDDQVMLLALENFINSITAFNTKFDKGFELDQSLDPNQDFSNFTRAENLGKKLYNDNCANCHSAKHDLVFKPIGNNGLDMVYEDKGAGTFAGSNFDGHFKIPFLRNIALTAPYMHDGRFASLEEVIDHYSSGIKNHRNLSRELKTFNDPKVMNFSESDKKNLIAYLNTLTDETIINDKKFSDPWIR